jgi:alkylation response protein AidB-like acyl-CoA dehydrogenase
MAKDAIGFALSALNRLAGSSMLDRLGMRHTAERLAYRLTKGGFQVITTSARAFKSNNPSDKPQRLDAPGHTTGLFDLGITDEQRMIRDSVRAFAAEVLRENAEQSDAEQRTSDDVQSQARELGLNFFAVPEALGGAAAERSTVTSMLVAEELARGDMGQAVAVLAPMGVANALTRWGSAVQQDKYLSTFAGEDAPLATIAVCEPRPLFDPMTLRTTATRDGDDWLLSGEKSLVPLAAEAELFLVAAETGDGPAVFIIEGGSEGLSAGDDPAMGIRASGQRPLLLDKVRVPMAWCALAIGTAQAVLDYVVPYCNERKAFGEPISHRQAVAFMVADIAIELDAMRMLTYRAVCRAEQGKPFQRETHLARTLVKDKAMQIGTDGVQLLGGHGFTHEYPVERWYRDLRAIGVVFGGLHL